MSGRDAVLVPKQHVVSVTSPKTAPPPPGSIGFGEHKLDIQYHLNGQPFSCHFDVVYSEKAAYRFHGFWELHDVN